MNSAAIKRFAVIVPAYNASETIVDCLDAILNSTRKPSEVIVYNDGLTDNVNKIALPPNVRVIANHGAPIGPARGRNAVSRESTCDVLIFVDADVIVAKDAFGLLLAEMEGDAQIWAAFGSYDHTPRVTRLVALYANLRHHWVHQSGQREAVTFWAGLGAVRRKAFWAVGGFDEKPGISKIEDIELGTRLKRERGRIRLVPEALGTHCKDWTIAQLWRTDIFYRAIPWARLLASGACVGGHSKQRHAGALVGSVRLSFPADTGWLFPVGLVRHRLHVCLLFVHVFKSRTISIATAARRSYGARCWGDAALALSSVRQCCLHGREAAPLTTN